MNRRDLAILKSGADGDRRPVAVLAVDLVDGDAVQLTPDGTFRARDGRPTALAGWRIDAAIAERVLTRLRQRTTPIVVDYEHQTLLADSNGRPAPAAGWIDPKAIEYRPGEGFFSPVRWTLKAKAMIDAGEYAFLSPVLPFDPDTGEILDIMNVALTNSPALDGMDPVAALRDRFELDPPAKTAEQESDTVDRKKLIALLGLSADATDDQIEAGLATLKATADDTTKVREALGLKADADLPASVVALKTAAEAAPADKDVVPRAVFDEQAQQLAALKADGQTAELDQLLKDGLADGRIPGKATADWLRSQGLAALKTYLSDAPPVAALKQQQTAGKSPSGDDKQALTPDELAVCKNMQLDPEKYRAEKQSAAA